MGARAAAAGLLTGVALVLAGCGTGGAAKKGALANGKTQFLATHKLDGVSYSCAGCHTLKAAGAFGKQGPNLDEAFAFAHDAANKGDRFKESTIANVVLDQIRYPAINVDPALHMPANLVTGQDAQDVAAYVASVAGKPVATATSAASK